MKTSRSTIQLRHDSQLNHLPAQFGSEKWKFSFLLLMLFFLVLFLPGFLFAQSPVAHYPLDGNGNDVSGNSLNGTIVGSITPTTDRFGNANAALNFSGSGQVDVNSSFTDQNFSVSMWLKPGTTQNQFADIVDNNHTGTQNWVCQQDGSITNRYVFGVHTSSGGTGVFFNLVSGEWQHVVLVKSATTVEAYINGILIDSEPWSGTVNYSGQFFRLGNWGGGGRNWNGSMDQVKYFNQALTESEILAEFQLSDGLVAYYPFSGNANDAEGTLNGTVNGAALTTDRFGNPNSAYQFDGVNDAISFPSLPMNNIDNFTLMAWVNPAEFDPGNQFNRMIVSLGPGDKGYNYGMGNVSGSGAGNQLGGLYNFVSWLPSGSFFANPNQWYHTAMVRENGVTKFYLNGVQAPNTFTATPNQMTTDFQIGGQAFDPTHFWKGGIDEVKIYNVALNANQVEKEFFSQADYGDQFGNAALLDGANDHITIPNNAALNPASVTVEAWVRPMGFTSTKLVNTVRQYIVFKQNTQTSSFEGFAVQMIESCKCFEVGVTSASGQSPVLNSPNNSIELGKNYHLALVANNTELKFYVNGVLQGTAPTGFELNYGTKPVFIGRSGENSFEGFFNGRVDEVRIWNTTRSQNEIQSTINSQLSGTETGLVGYWDMNRTGQGTGLVVENKATATGSALNGTTGGSVTTPVFTLGSTMALHKPGSGNALSFNGSNQVNSTQMASSPNNFTMEAWVNPNSTTTLHGQSTDGAGGQFGNNQFVVFPLHGIALGSGSQNAGAGFSVGTNGICVYEHGDSYIPVLLSWSGTISGWTHVSVVYTNKQPSLYVNGILVATGLTSGRTNVFASSSEIGGGAYGHFNGAIDEFRIWNSSLSQIQIRDRMCRKITSTDALFDNLVTYYNFDESTGNTAFDGAANAISGTLSNNPTRITSGAAIGNSSSHNYVSTGFPASNLTSNGQDNLAVALTSGTFTGEAGTHVYAVSEKPNSESGIENPGSNDRYFGVFHAGLANPIYTATYNYSGNSFVTTGNEGQLGLFKRNDNAGTTWANANATLNTTANTLTVTGQSTEYVLGIANCTPPATPTISAGGPTTFCSGDSVTLTSSSPTGNIWSNGATSQSIKVKTAGNFTVQVVLVGCSSAVSTASVVTVNTPPVPSVISSPSGNSFCSGSSIILQSDQSTLLQWLRNGSNINGQTSGSLTVSTAGTYSVKRTQNGCSSFSNTLVISENTSVPAVPVINSGGQTSFCANASLGMISSATEGNQWIRNGSDITGATSNNYSATEAGTYAVRVTTGGCSSTSSNLVLTTLAPPTISISGSAPGICPDSPVVLSTTGTSLVSRDWKKDGNSLGQFGTTFSASEAGQYSVTGTAANGCQATSSPIQVLADAIPVLSSNKPANTICSGNSITLSVSGGASFLWNTGATTSSISVSPVTNSEFSVRTTGALGCVFRDTLQVSVVPSVLPGAVSNMLPDNGTINQENAITFSWQPATGAISYDLYVWPSLESRPSNATVSGITGISAQVSNLNFGTVYNSQVVSRSACQQANGPVQKFSTRNLPDLVVSNVVYSNNRTSPGGVLVSYMVQNAGAGNAIPASWSESLYISLDSVFDVSDQKIGTSQNLTGLLPGASYANQISGTLSEEKVGPYFLFVRINDQNSIFESNLANNIASGNPGKMFVTVNNTRADLTSNRPVSVPPVAIGGTSLNFNYEIVNTGELLAEGRNSKNILIDDFIYLNNPPTQLLCESFIDQIEVNSWEDQVYLSKDSIFNPFSATRVGLVEVNPKMERPFTGSSCLEFKQVPNGLQKNEHLVKSSQIRIPVSAFGKHFLHVVMNERNPFEERSRANNVVSSFGFEVILRPPPDLNLVSGNLGANEISILKPLSVQYQVENIGNNTAKSWTDQIFVSKSAVFNNTARLLVTNSLDSLPVGQSYQKISGIRIPEEFEGQAFIHIRTGNGLFEHTFTSNNNLVLPVTVTRTTLPDLRILALSALSTPVQNEQVVFRVKVKNTGNAPTFAKPLEVRISASKTGDFEDLSAVSLSSALFDSLGVNDEQILEIPILIPQGFSGQIFFRGSLDDGNIQPELQEGNNQWYSVYGGPGPGGTGGNPIGTGTGNSPSDPFVAGPAVIPGPQLDGRILSVVAPNPATSEFETTVRIKVEPVSPQISFPFYASLRLTLTGPENSTLTVSTRTISVLINDTSTQVIQCNLSFAPKIQGNSILTAFLDLGTLQFRDLNTANNSVSKSIELVRPALPDLVITSAESQSGTQSGSFFTIPVVVTNQGPGNLQSGTQQRAYLSNSPSGLPTFLNIGNGSSLVTLDAGQSMNDTIRGYIPSNISGNFFLVIKADANNENFEGEQGEENNVFVSGIVVNPPPSVDLVPESVTLPSSITLGKNVNGSLICRNVGPGLASGTIQNLLRVSNAIDFDPETDSELGIKMQAINLPSNGVSSVSFRGNVGGILPGTYRALGQVNSKFTLPETNLLNNSALSPSSLTVGVANLPIGQTRTETNLESNEISYYKLTATEGLDLKITYHATQAFASFGKVPTFAVAGFRPKKNGFTTSFVIPSTQAGDYYFGLIPENLGGNLTTEILVLAKEFGVESISPSLVGTGKVSTYISGAGFNDETIFEAFRGNTLIATGTILKRFNSMEARVKWDFTGLATGPCTIKVRKGTTTGVTNGSLTLEVVRPARLLSERIGTSRTRSNATVVQNFRFFNDGNVDIEYALGIVMFPGMTKATSISVSENALFLGNIQDKAGIRCNKLTKQAYLDVFVQIPVFYKDLGPGEEFSTRFKLNKFTGISSLPIARQGFNLTQPQVMKMLAEEVEKVRFAHIYQPTAFFASANRDSATNSGKFRSAAFRRLVSSQFITQSMVDQFSAGTYKPDFFAGNMKSYGTFNNPLDVIERSAFTVLGKSYNKNSLPAERNLIPFMSGNALVTYSPLFFSPISNFMNNARSNAFNPRLNPSNLKNIQLTVSNPAAPSQTTSVSVSNSITRTTVFGPINLFYRNLFKPTGIPPLPPFPAPPPNLTPPNPAPNNAWAPFESPDFVPVDPPVPDPDPSDIDFEIDFDNAVSHPSPPDQDVEIEFGEPTVTNVCPEVPLTADCVTEGDMIGENRCGVTYQLCLFTYCIYSATIYIGDDCEVTQMIEIDYDCIDIEGSCDPNEINGPLGYGKDRMVSKNKDLSYTIKFENDPKLATAAAQTVRVVQPLDANFKASSFKLGTFGFGNQEFTIPAGQNTFSTQLDFSEDKGIKVDVSAALDVPGKRLIWSFSTIDAVTGQPSSNPESGFLPVNDSTGKGEGFVSYTIQAGDPTETGDSLRARASIFFDFNEPVVTNKHFNVVDALPPVTNVTSPSGTQASTEVVFEWTTNDDAGASGASQTWILYKKDAGSLDTLGLFPADTSQIIGEGFETGHTYQFFFHSTDFVGNIEALPTNPQMTVVIGDAGPSFTMTAPTAGQTACSNDTVRIRWTTTKTSGTVDLFYKASPASGPVLIASGVSAVPGRFDWVNPAFATSNQAQIVLAHSPFDSAFSGLFTSSVITKPVVIASGPLIFCQGGSVMLSTNAAAGHRWSNGATSPSITISSSGTFVDTAKAGGCQSVSDPVSLVVNPLPVVNAGADVTIEAGDSTFLTATGASTYQWSPITGISPSAGNTATVKAMPTQTTLYTVLGTDGNQCSASDQVLVTVNGVSGPLQAPVISPATGTYDGPQMVTITTANPGAKIYYTTSGNTPVVGTGFTKEYLAPFQVIQSSTIRAMVVKTGQANSPVAVSYITITNPGIVATPVISPGTGTFGPPQTITLSCATTGAQIWYTTTGNTPVIGTGFTKQYVGPFQLPVTGTVKAMAVKAGSANSAIATAVITITNPTPTVATPVITPGTGIYAGPQSVNITCATPGATILYTTTGNVPVIGAGFTRTFSAPFVVNTSTTIRAMAMAPGANNSAVAVAYITIGPGREAVDNSLDESSEGIVRVFPNPSSSGRFHIQLPENADAIDQFTVLSLDGKILWTASPSGKTELEIDLSDRPSGLYLLRFHDGTTLKTIRLSKF